MKCVSVFDYRTASDEQFRHSLDNCAPWQAAGACGYELAIFVLSADASSALIPWTAWRDSLPNSAMMVPHVEACYPGSIPCTTWDEIIEVYFDRNSGPHIAALERQQLLRRNDADAS
jgi:hypothetical protein